MHIIFYYAICHPNTLALSQLLLSYGFVFGERSKPSVLIVQCVCMFKLGSRKLTYLTKLARPKDKIAKLAR